MKAIKGIGKITKTMEMVSVAKMKRANARAALGRVYEELVHDILSHIPSNVLDLHPLLLDRPEENDKHLVVLIAADKGLAGGYNTQLARELNRYIAKYPNTSVVTIGKTADKVARKVGVTIMASFGILPEALNPEEIFPIVRFIIRTFNEDAQIADCKVLSQRLIGAISTEPQMVQLLPLSRLIRETDIDTSHEFVIEPDPRSLLDVVLPGFVESLLLQYVLEARAAEHTVRMVAMKSASDSAASYYKELLLSFNRGRQAAITQEIAEIVSGANAIT